MYPTTGDVLATQLKSAECEVTTPFPERGRFTRVLEGVIVNAAIPLAFPEPEGSKLTPKGTDCPGARVTPEPIPVVAKPGPDTEFC